MLENTIVSNATGGKVNELQLPAADGGSIHCISAGTGPTVLLAHGFMLDLTAYDPIFDQLVQRGYRVVAFDNRGAGQTSAPASRALYRLPDVLAAQQLVADLAKLVPESFAA